MDQQTPVTQIPMFTQVEGMATNNNSDDGKLWIRFVDAVNINVTEPPYTPMTLIGGPAS